MDYIYITIDGWIRDREKANAHILEVNSWSYDKVYESVSDNNNMSSNDIVYVFFCLEELCNHEDQMPLEDPRMNWMS